MVTNKIILKIELIDDKSLDFTMVYVDKRLLTDMTNGGKTVHFHSSNYDFVIYSGKTLKGGRKSLRLPSLKNYEKNTKIKLDFKDEEDMKDWLKKLHRAITECNHNFTPFVNSSDYHKRPYKVFLRGKHWIL